MTLGDYQRPTELQEALRLRASGSWKILAGGTDHYPNAAHQQAWGQSQSPNILDITGIDELEGISETDAEFRIGATTKWSAFADPALPSLFEALATASLAVGGQQIQNQGTIAGNLCNASPAADGVPPLLVMDADIELASERGLRRVPLGSFILGNRKTALESDEILTAVLVPKSRSDETRTTFLKLGARRYLVISIVMVAGRIDLNESGVIESAALAVGACSSVAQRLPRLEKKLIGRSVSEDPSALVVETDLSDLSPISDPRADDEYRRDVARTLVQRTLQHLVSPPKEAAA